MLPHIKFHHVNVYRCLGGVGASRVPTLSLLLLCLLLLLVSVAGVTGCRRPAPSFQPPKMYIHLVGNYYTGSYFLCDRLSHALCAQSVCVLHHYICIWHIHYDCVQKVNGDMVHGAHILQYYIQSIQIVHFTLRAITIFFFFFANADQRCSQRCFLSVLCVFVHLCLEHKKKNAAPQRCTSEMGAC